MAITAEEMKKRRDVLDREKQAVAELNDLTEMRERIRRNKDLNNQEVERSEESQKKIATPPADKDKTL